MPFIPKPVSISSAGFNSRVFSAFGIFGFANTLLPHIIFSGLYLIIPFPRPIVLIIELLPALAVELLFPHALGYIPHWVWPVLVANCWILATIVTNAAPPNVVAPIRTLIAILASASTATGRVFFSSQLSIYGKTALAGWGTGIAAGSVVRDILPTVLTIYANMVLRYCVGYAYCLLLAIVAAYFLILPSPPMQYELENSAAKGKFTSGIEDQKLSLLPGELSSANMSFWARFYRNMHLLGNKLFRLCINPLLLVTAVQILVSPGTTRASIMLPIFSRYSAFSTAHGLTFQLGNLLARSTALLFRTRRPKLIFALLVFCTTATILNTAFLLTANAYFLFSSLFAIGWLGGMMYMNIFGAAMDYLGRNPETDAEFTLGSIGIGETAGTLIGSLAGVTFDTQLCGLAKRNGRWCSALP
ncbi:Batten's disease protein Cln3 [Trichoderma austrokoningii]